MPWRSQCIANYLSILHSDNDKSISSHDIKNNGWPNQASNYTATGFNDSPVNGRCDPEKKYVHANFWFMDWKRSPLPIFQKFASVLLG